jgi:hypothetical protein
LATSAASALTGFSPVRAGVFDVPRFRFWTRNWRALEEVGWKGAAGSALSCDFTTRVLFAEALEGAARHPMIDHIWRKRRTIVRHDIAVGSAIRRLLIRALAARETGLGAKGIQ